VVRPGGTLTIVDYAPPSRFNPLRYFWKPVLDRLEPFAHDLFSEEVAAWLPKDGRFVAVSKQRFFGGMYQMLTLKLPRYRAGSRRVAETIGWPPSRECSGGASRNVDRRRRWPARERMKRGEYTRQMW
jgi:hypothetical protein